MKRVNKYILEAVIISDIGSGNTPKKLPLIGSMSIYTTE